MVARSIILILIPILNKFQLSISGYNMYTVFARLDARLDAMASILFNLPLMEATIREWLLFKATFIGNTSVD